MKTEASALIPIERVASKIYVIRNERVLLDFDLAELYGGETRALKQAVKRNIKRFPIDFMFQLSKDEWRELITVCDNLNTRIFSPATPFVFTEQGVAMLSSVLNSERAVHVNIAIMRAFVQMRKFLQSNEELAKKLKELEKKTSKQFATQQKQIKLVFDAIKELMLEKVKPNRKIGF